ncbi:hypothetical protein GGF42_008202 [Coemansia sp. RSA 2424]|nr:hypothetical protein GGF42_008202 [Coemansia sp. RSA 2424]
MEVDRGIAGAILAVAGVFFLAVAHRYQQLTHYPSVCAAWFALVYLLCTALHPPTQPPGQGDNIRRRTVYLAIGIMQGVGMTLVSSCLLKKVRLRVAGGLWAVFGRVCLGGLSGSALAFYIMAMSQGGLVQSAGGRAAVAVVCSVVVTIPQVYLPARAFSASSAVLGAYLLVLGVDCFARTGYINHMAVFTRCRLDVEYRAERPAMVLQAAALVLAMLSVSLQRLFALLRFRNSFVGK